MKEIEKEKGNLDLRVEGKLREKELEWTRELDRPRLVIRLGPALGLLGTLIPLSIALSAISQGNLETVANSLITALTTTVVGLAEGALAYFISTIKENWLQRDILAIESLTELIMQNLPAVKFREPVYTSNKNKIE